MMAKDQQKPISRSYAIKGDDVPKTKQTNILVYAVKGDDDKKTELLKPGKSFIRFIWCANYAKF